MDESLNQSVSVRKPGKKIRLKKAKYTNLTILLLIVHCFSILIQKHLERDNFKSNKTVKITKNIFLAGENVCITIFIIILLCKINNDLIILFSILYFLIGIVMLFYIFLNRFCGPSDGEKKEKIEGEILFLYIFNNILFFIEGYFLFLCSEIMEKEKIIVNREKYGYKNDEDILKAEKIMKNTNIE